MAKVSAGSWTDWLDIECVGPERDFSVSGQTVGRVSKFWPRLYGSTWASHPVFVADLFGCDGLTVINTFADEADAMAAVEGRVRDHVVPLKHGDRLVLARKGSGMGSFEVLPMKGSLYLELKRLLNRPGGGYLAFQMDQPDGDILILFSEKGETPQRVQRVQRVVSTKMAESSRLGPDDEIARALVAIGLQLDKL
jgi:hypothetical protein